MFQLIDLLNSIKSVRKVVDCFYLFFFLKKKVEEFFFLPFFFLFSPIYVNILLPNIRSFGGMVLFLANSILKGTGIVY